MPSPICGTHPRPDRWIGIGPLSPRKAVRPPCDSVLRWASILGGAAMTRLYRRSPFALVWRPPAPLPADRAFDRPDLASRGSPASNSPRRRILPDRARPDRLMPGRTERRGARADRAPAVSFAPARCSSASGMPAALSEALKGPRSLSDRPWRASRPGISGVWGRKHAVDRQLYQIVDHEGPGKAALFRASGCSPPCPRQGEARLASGLVMAPLAEK